MSGEAYGTLIQHSATQPKPAGPPLIGNQRNYIHFFGEDPSSPTSFFELDVMAGDSPPTIMDGYAQYSTVARPLWRGLTQFTGYNPTVMQLSVRFMAFDRNGNWIKDNTGGLWVEQRIEILEWMAGTGRESGQPPFVYLSTYDNQGNTIPLIPFQYQADTPNYSLVTPGGDANPWVINGGIQWDASPIRNYDQYRIKQDATLTVQYQSSVDPGTKAMLPRPKGTTVTARVGNDTPALIARSAAANNAPKLAWNIVHCPQNKSLGLRGINQRIKDGKRVYIPSSTDG